MQAANAVGALGHDEVVAVRAAVAGGLHPAREVAAGAVATIVLTAEEDAAAPAAHFALHQRTAVLRAGDADLVQQRLGAFALRVARAGQELAEAALFDHHARAALRAELAAGGRLFTLALQRLGAFALRIARAGQELAEAAPAQEHLGAALR